MIRASARQRITQRLNDEVPEDEDVGTFLFTLAALPEGHDTQYLADLLTDPATLPNVRRAINIVMEEEARPVSNEPAQVVVVMCMGCLNGLMTTSLSDQPETCPSCGTVFGTEPMPLYARMPSHTHGIDQASQMWLTRRM